MRVPKVFTVFLDLCVAMLTLIMMFSGMAILTGLISIIREVDATSKGELVMINPYISSALFAGFVFGVGSFFGVVAIQSLNRRIETEDA